MTYTRHYYAYKAAKDFVLLHKQDSFTSIEVQRMFDSKALLNYLNDVVMHTVEMYLQMVEKQTFDEDKSMSREAQIQPQSVLKMQKSLVGMDTSYFFLAEMFNNDSISYYLERLTDFEDFTPDYLISPKYGLEYYYFNEGQESKLRYVLLDEQNQGKN